MKLWTASEMASVRSLYPGAPWIGILHALPGRNRNQVRLKAERMGVVRRSHHDWLGSEVVLLRKKYSTDIATDALCALFPRHSAASIRRKAYEFGLRRKKQKKTPRYSLLRALQDERERLGLTQREIARRIRFQPQDYNKFEIGTRVPSFELLLRWGKALGLELRWKPIRASMHERNSRQWSDRSVQQTVGVNNAVR